MAGQTQTQASSSLPIVKWTVEMEIQGEIKRPTVVTSYTIKGLLKRSTKEVVIQNRPEVLSCPMLTRDASGPGVIRCCEIPPNASSDIKIKYSLEPIAQLFGMSAFNYHSVQQMLTPSEYSLVQLMIRPRIRISTKVSAERTEAQQGIRDDLGPATSNPHTITYYYVPKVVAEIHIVPVIADVLTTPEFLEFVPRNLVGNPFYQIHQKLISEALKTLTERVLELEWFGGRTLHVSSIKISSPETVGQVPVNQQLLQQFQQAYNSLLQKVQRTSICQFNKQYLQNIQNQQPSRRPVWR